jgi:hypothetical protein
LYAGRVDVLLNHSHSSFATVVSYYLNVVDVIEKYIAEVLQASLVVDVVRFNFVVTCI